MQQLAKVIPDFELFTTYTYILLKILYQPTNPKRLTDMQKKLKKNYILFE